MRALALIVAGFLSVSTSQAAIITQWNFNSLVPDGNTSTGNPNPSIGMGSFTLLNGTTSTFASGNGSTDPAVDDDSGLNITGFAPQGEVPARGIQFNVSTVGFQNITITFDQRHSNTSTRDVNVTFTSDGMNFVNSGTTFQATAGDTFFNNRMVSFSMSANNNANFAFQILQAFGVSGPVYIASNPSSSYSPNGTWRFDQVTISGDPINAPPPVAQGVPAPGALILLATGAFSGLAFRRMRRS